MITIVLAATSCLRRPQTGLSYPYVEVDISQRFHRTRKVAVRVDDVHQVCITCIQSPVRMQRLSHRFHLHQSDSLCCPMDPSWIEPTDPLHFLTSRLLHSVGKEATDMRTQAVPNTMEVGGRLCLCVQHLGRHVGQAARVGYCLRVVRPDVENVAPSEECKGEGRGILVAFFGSFFWWWKSS